MEELDTNVNKQKFILVTNPDASFEDYGWTKEYVETLLYIERFEPDNECMTDPGALNDLGIMFGDGIGTEVDMERAIKYYGLAATLGDDLAKSNLADIYRKGTNGVEKDLKRAFELYLNCHLPYAYYRVGEAYELGRGVAKDLKKAKQYYRIAYDNKHPLAKRQLQAFNFLVD